MYVSCRVIMESSQSRVAAVSPITAYADAYCDAWFGHPDGFGNTLIVDGQTIPNGVRAFYDDNGCPGD